MKLKEFNYKDKILTLFSLSTLSMVLIGLLLFKHKRMPLSYNVLNDFGLGPLTLRDNYLHINRLRAAIHSSLVFDESSQLTKNHGHS
jgi:hypothetical protein